MIQLKLVTLFAFVCFLFFFSGNSVSASESIPVMNDTFKEYRHDNSIYRSALPHLNELGLKSEDLVQMDVPKNWFIQWRTFPKNCTYEKNEDGFHIHSPDGALWIMTRSMKIMNCKYCVSLDVTNVSSEDDAEILLECVDTSSMLCEDMKRFGNITLEKNARKTITYEYSCKDGCINVAPSLKIKGDVLLHSFRIDAVPEKGVTCIEGTIIERSELPDPAKSNYPNCRYTIHFKGNAILAGEMCKRELVLTIEGFQNKKMLETDTVKAGDKVQCTVIPFDSLSEKEQETQVADDLNLFQLDSYYVLGINKIEEFSSPVSRFADGVKTYTSIFDRHINPALSDGAVLEQKEQIQNTLRKMNELCKDYIDLRDLWNRMFAESMQTEIAKTPEGKNRIILMGHDCLWKEMNQSFWIFPFKQPLIRKYTHLAQKKIDALLALQKCLNANGVQLIVSIVPHVFDISARVMFPEYRSVPDFRTALLVKELSEIGIEALYASDSILANYNRYPFAYLIPQDGHPGDTVQDVLAEQMAKRLERYHFTKKLDKNKFNLQSGTHIYASNKKCMFPVNCDIGDNQSGTAYSCQCVFYDGKELQCDRNSEILIIGNSYIMTPRGNPESYPAHLARYLLVNPDCYMVQSHGPMVTLMERLFANPEKYLKGKKVVILQMGEEHFHANIIWNNIESMDRYQVAMTGKKLVKMVTPIGENIKSDNPLVLAEKREYLCKKNTKTTIATIDCSELDISKTITCLIPACASESGKILLHCNGNSQIIPVYLSYDSAWNQLVFELPAGTKEISVSVSGPENAIAAIQKIQILQ